MAMSVRTGSEGLWMCKGAIGHGGFGTVYHYENKENSSSIAVKICRIGSDPGMGMTEEQKIKWQKEIRIMLRLNHPGIVKALNLPEELSRLEVESGLPALAMEYCSGGDLRKVLCKVENCCGMRESQCRSLIIQVANAISYLHSSNPKITHRDLKPENIVIQEVNGQNVYKLIDLGYAKELDQSSVCSSFVGTLQYLAPELFTRTNYSLTVDYWSLGLLAHECLTGCRPFLPLLAPVKWMPFVASKKRDHIRAYVDENGQLQLASEMTCENHISPIFRKYMESWLRLALEWDPKLRGHDRNNKLTLFSDLEAILSKKILEVFVVSHVCCVYYEITNDVTWLDLSEWVQRDTGLLVEDQHLVLARGRQIDRDLGPLSQCFNADCGIKDEESHVYVFKLTNPTEVDMDLKNVPQSVQKMLVNRESVSPEEQKIMWCQSVFVIQRESIVYRKMLHSHRALMMNFVYLGSFANKLLGKLNMLLHRLKAKEEMLNRSLMLDLERYAHLMKTGHAGSIEEYEDWEITAKVMFKNIKELQDKVLELERSLQNSNSKLTELQKMQFAKGTSSDTMDSWLKDACDTFENLKKREKSSYDNMDMVRILFHSIKAREKILKGVFAQLDTIVSNKRELDCLLEPLSENCKVAKELLHDIGNLQTKRQTDIWNMTDQLVAKVQTKMSPRDENASLITTTSPRYSFDMGSWHSNATVTSGESPCNSGASSLSVILNKNYQDISEVLEESTKCMSLLRSFDIAGIDDTLASMSSPRRNRNNSVTDMTSPSPSNND